MRVPAKFEPKASIAAAGGVGVIRSVPAPVGGWNARDPLAQMKPLDAVILENWFPRVSDTIIRGGATDWLTGLGVWGKALLPYNAPTGTRKLFVATDANIYDATSAGAAGAGLSACTDGRWQYVQMGSSAGSYLICANGVDKMKYYDGTNWIIVDNLSTPAITNVTTSNIIGLTVYNRRLFMIEITKLGFWYLPADAVGGAATYFDLGPVTKRGGYLMAMGTWSFDGGDGPDDYIAFVTSEGEVVIYKGTNPNDATAWFRVGTYFVGRPPSRRCLVPYGSELVLLSQNGAFPLSAALSSAAIDYKLALTDKILSAFNAAMLTYFSNFGWEGCVLPSQSAILFNVPVQEFSTSNQYVMNTITKSWCKFTGWNASCMVEFNKELYFATNGKVVKAWTGTSDFGNNITAYAKTAYNYLQSMGHKRFNLVRPLLLADGPLSYNIGLSVDFQQEVALSPATASSITGALWDVALWDVGLWAGNLEIIQDWRTTQQKPGSCASLLLSIATNSVTVQWASNDYFYEQLSNIVS